MNSVLISILIDLQTNKYGKHNQIV